MGSRPKRFLNRGGNWNNGANAGVFNSNFNYARSNSNHNVGFRSALRLRQLTGHRLKGHGTERSLKGVCFPPAAEVPKGKDSIAVEAGTSHTAFEAGGDANGKRKACRGVRHENTLRRLRKNV